MTLSLNDVEASMKVICVSNTSDFIALIVPVNRNMPVGNLNFISGSEYYSGVISNDGSVTMLPKDTVGYNLTVGKSYSVNGVLFLPPIQHFPAQTRFLLTDDTGRLGFFKDSLFAIDSPLLPADWAFAKYDIVEGNIFYIGCHSSAERYDDLLDIINADH